MKKVKSFKSGLVLTLGLALVSLSIACAVDDGKEDKNRIDTNKIMKQSATNVEASSELTKAAEALMQTYAFIYADKVLDQAVELDTNNKKAQFLSKVLKTQVIYKGFYERVKPLATKITGMTEDINRVEASAPNMLYKDMLFGQYSGKAISNEAELQSYVDDIQTTYKDLAKYINTNKDDLNISISVNSSHGLSQLDEAFVKNCEVVSTEPGVYEIVNRKETHELYNCSLLNRGTVKLNRADLEVIEQAAVGAQIYLSGVNRYNVSGAVEVANIDRENNLSRVENWSYLSQNENFGLLRSSALVSFVDIGMGAIAALRYAEKMQDELCPNGNYKDVRYGYVFRNGMCRSSDTSSRDISLAQIESLINGGNWMIENAKYKGDLSKTYDLEIKPSAFFDSPVVDLKALKPEFNTCGEVIKITDSLLSLNGFLPNSDANAILSVTSGDCDAQ